MAKKKTAIVSLLDAVLTAKDEIAQQRLKEALQFESDYHKVSAFLNRTFMLSRTY